VPRAVVKVNSEEEVIRLLQFCHRSKMPVTFKAAGTSLSGQTISDSILMEIGEGFSFSGYHRQRHNGYFWVRVNRSCGKSYVAALSA